jgi:hypothetical protein
LGIDWASARLPKRREEGDRAIDWFDLMMHGLPWILLAAKLVAGFSRRNP